MPFGFYIIMAAQFFSALADNVLLLVAIDVLRITSASDAYEPLLKTYFAISYVLFAAFVGAFADSMPKWRVMFISNSIKIFGCATLFFGVDPLIAYAIVGLGAAAYSPAKYGILTEYLPARLLVTANSWIEGLTVAAIVLGTVIGGFLIRPEVSQYLLSFDFLLSNATEINLSIIGFLYIVAAFFNLYVPDTGVDHKSLRKSPIFLIAEFSHCVKLLWRDKLGQISLAVTTLFWGAGATLQFIVLQWGESNLNLSLSDAALLQGIVALGVAVGAVSAAYLITLKKSVKVIPLGILMGFAVLLMIITTNYWLAALLLATVGCLSGFFVVPMNALLQHRGHILMGAGHSIAVQNFNEHVSILIMTAIYFIMKSYDLSIAVVLTSFGLFVAGMMFLIQLLHWSNQRQNDDVAHLDDTSVKRK